MPITDCDQAHQLEALGGKPEIALLQCGNQLIKTDIWIGHESFFRELILTNNDYPLL